MSAFIKAILLGGCVISMVVQAHNGVDHTKPAHAGNQSSPIPAMPIARHGGTVHQVQEIDYELVGTQENLSLYLSKRGQSIDAKGTTAVATLILNGEKQDVRLLATGGNRLEARLNSGLPRNTTVLVNIARPKHSAIRIQFVLK